MRNFKTVVSLVLLLLVNSCTKEKKVPIYKVEEANAYRNYVSKNKPKSGPEYISILSASLFQKSLSANALADHDRVIQSVGDKTLVNEVIISNFMNSPDVLLPSDSFMRADVDSFIIATYKKFYVRTPTELELTWFKNYINNNPDLTVELVYTAFASSDEYLFY